MTEQFERKLARYSNAKHAVAVNNGSSALMCALMAQGAMCGDLVLVPDYTHVATANVPKLLGCRVSLVDIDPRTFNIDYQSLERTLGDERPKFVVVVDVAGLPNDMDILRELSQKYEFTLIEDAAESIGAEYKGRRVGSLGCTATLSFHAAKQLTTIEGGAILTDKAGVAQRCRLVRNHGEPPNRKYFSETLGMNFRTTDIQSALGLVQLGKLDDQISRRNQIVLCYRKELCEWFTFQVVPSFATRHAHMMFVALTRSRKLRDNLKAHLQKARIETRTPWPPLHTQPNFRTSDVHFPNSSMLYERSISLPLFNGMHESEVERVVSEVRSFMQHSH